jgi:hypothetical protein
MAVVRHIFHRLSCSNEMVGNIPKHELWFQWSGSGALVVNNACTTSFGEIVR